MSEQRSLSEERVRGAIVRATGRHYNVKWGQLDEESVREVLRLLRDLEDDRLHAVKRARMEPWRTGR